MPKLTEERVEELLAAARQDAETGNESNFTMHGSRDLYTEMLPSELVALCERWLAVEARHEPWG